MKRGEYGPHTRGEWLHNELTWAVLAVLDVSRRCGVPPLTLKALTTMTGGNYHTINKMLPKWIGFGWIKRHPPRRAQRHVRDVYSYSLTAAGKQRMFRIEVPKQRNTLTFKPGVNREAMVKRIPYFNNGRLEEK